MKEFARGDDGSLVGIVQFDHETVERELGELKDDVEQFTPNEIEAGLKFLKIFLKWAWRDGNVDANGLGIRLGVLCWVFLDEVKPLKQSEVSKVIGKNHRQSFNRWAINFRDTFKQYYEWKHKKMKSDKAREHYKQLR